MTFRERLAEWVMRYGPIPEDATHLYMVDTLAESDLMKVEDGVVYAHFLGAWRRSIYRLEHVDHSEFAPIKHEGELI